MPEMFWAYADITHEIYSSQGDETQSSYLQRKASKPLIFVSNYLDCRLT